VIDRRAFISGIAAGLLAAPLAVQAQQSGKVWRIGLLVSGPPPGEHQCVLALRRGLTDLGYVEGRTHLFEIRWTEGRSEDTFPRFGAELVRLGVRQQAVPTIEWIFSVLPKLLLCHLAHWQAVDGFFLRRCGKIRTAAGGVSADEARAVRTDVGNQPALRDASQEAG